MPDIENNRYHFGIFECLLNTLELKFYINTATLKSRAELMKSDEIQNMQIEI